MEVDKDYITMELEKLNSLRSRKLKEKITEATPDDEKTEILNRCHELENIEAFERDINNKFDINLSEIFPDQEQLDQKIIYWLNLPNWIMLRHKIASKRHVFQEVFLPEIFGDEFVEKYNYFMSTSISHGAKYDESNGYWNIYTKKGMIEQSINANIQKELVSRWHFDKFAKRDALDYIKSKIYVDNDTNPFENNNSHLVAFKDFTVNMKKLLRNDDILSVFDANDTNNTDDFLEYHDPGHYLSSGFDYNIKTNIKEPTTILAYYEHLFGVNAQTMIEWTGFMFYRSYDRPNKLIILPSEGGQGKSFFIKNVLHYLLSPAFTNVSSLTMLEIVNGSDFKRSFMYAKLANISGDMRLPKNGYLENADDLKRIVGGDTVGIEFKGGDTFNGEIYATMLFGVNEPPLIHADKAMKDRLLLIPFIAPRVRDNNKARQEVARKFPLSKLHKERATFVIYAMREYMKARETQPEGITITKDAKSATDKWLDLSDDLQTFLDEETIFEEDHNGEGTATATIYKAFKLWQIDQGLPNTMTQTKFTQTLKRKGYEQTGRISHGYDGNIKSRRMLGIKLNYDMNLRVKNSI